MEDKNKQQEEYEYSVLTVYDEEGYGWDQSIDQILDEGLSHCSKDEKISYLNDIIRDVEHYRDTLE
jgi:hypothetical protein